MEQFHSLLLLLLLMMMMQSHTDLKTCRACTQSVVLTTVNLQIFDNKLNIEQVDELVVGLILFNLVRGAALSA